jgi:hypothetical protein
MSLRALHQMTSDSTSATARLSIELTRRLSKTQAIR